MNGKIVQVKISYDLIVYLLLGKCYQLKSFETNLPKDIRIIRIVDNNEDRTISCYLESETFTYIKDGEDVPLWGQLTETEEGRIYEYIEKIYHQMCAASEK